jgi:hypothetical protein
MPNTGLPIKTGYQHITTTQGLAHYSVLLSEFFEDELPLEALIVLSTSSILPSLSYMPGK